MKEESYRDKDRRSKYKYFKRKRLGSEGFQKSYHNVQKYSQRSYPCEYVICLQSPESRVQSEEKNYELNIKYQDGMAPFFNAH